MILATITLADATTIDLHDDGAWRSHNTQAAAAATVAFDNLPVSTYRPDPIRNSAEEVAAILGGTVTYAEAGEQTSEDDGPQ